MKDERTQISTDKDADDDVSVVVHGQKHDKVSNSKLHHVKQRSDGLLPDVGSEGGKSEWSSAGCDILGTTIRAAAGDDGGRGRGALEVGGVLAEEVSVPFLDGAAEHFEGYDEENGADAGAGEHAAGGDVP